MTLESHAPYLWSGRAVALSSRNGAPSRGKFPIDLPGDTLSDHAPRTSSDQRQPRPGRDL
jgi:hypothetical protein